MPTIKKRRKGTPRPGNGGRRAGAGRPHEFIPTKAMRDLVKMHLALRSYSYAQLCEVLINPATGEPIDVSTFMRHFKREISIAKVDLDGVAMTGFAKQLRRGNMTAFIWHSKNLWGWTDKGRAMPFALPAITTTADVVVALASVAAAMSSGLLSSADASAVAGVIELQRKALEQAEMEGRVATLEQLAKIEKEDTAL